MPASFDKSDKSKAESMKTRCMGGAVVQEYHYIAQRGHQGGLLIPGANPVALRIEWSPSSYGANLEFRIFHHSNEHGQARTSPPGAPDYDLVSLMTDLSLYALEKGRVDQNLIDKFAKQLVRQSSTESTTQPPHELVNPHSHCSNHSSQARQNRLSPTMSPTHRWASTLRLTSGYLRRHRIYQETI